MSELSLQWWLHLMVLRSAANCEIMRFCVVATQKDPCGHSPILGIGCPKLSVILELLFPQSGAGSALLLFWHLLNVKTHRK